MEEKNTNKNLIPASIAVAGLLIAGAIIFIGQGSVGQIGPEEAGQKVVSYIEENNLLTPGVTVSLVDYSDEGNVYRVDLEIKEGDMLLGEIPSYVSKDGKFWFPEGYDMTQSFDQLQPEMDEQVQLEYLPEEIAALESFADCLYDNNFVIYGNDACPYCRELISLMGGKEVISEIYVDCEEERELCLEKNITGVPAVFIDNQEYVGPRSLEAFSQETGCIL